MNESPSQAGRQPPLSRRQRVDRWCDEFERLFKERLAAKSELPRIEDFLDRADPADREHLLRELLRVELELRQAAGQPGNAEDYCQRFAQYQQVVESLVDTTAFAASGDPYLTVTVVGQAPAGPSPAIAPGAIAADRRYEIQKVLGRGGFAVVYLARDTVLDRLVALKVPLLDFLSSEAAKHTFVDEARKAAQLDHPAIVRVHDVLHDPATVCIVQEYIDGVDLASHVKTSRLTARQCAEVLIATVAGVGHAHRQGFVHRDLKPQNILIDSSGQPHVADFGLSLHESVQRERAGELAGTCSYMSPEQVRCEVHRLDGRSDLWNLGVILYELLTGRRPFTGTTRNELFDEILHRDPKPPRMLDPTVPGELSRICLVCLAKRATDRYQSAADLIDDLRYWLDGQSETAATAHPSSTTQPASVATARATIIPKGLRSYDASDASFFLELLPGPRDREGLPKSVRFWKTRLEQRDSDETFTVGLMYGPSGCGKSSLVKAALLPRLCPNVLPIYVEATAADTEVRLLKALKKHCPDLPSDSSLPELMALLRDGGGSRGRKVVFVLDQFEQWLHAHAARDDSQLIPALRQCDGASVQGLVLVRDDFWMSSTRFMQALEVPLVEGHNSAAVDLLGLDDARKVLAILGRGYAKLPAPPAELTADHQNFLTQAVSDVADDGKVICVRLAVFAEMMKGRSWTTASLREVGGTTGIGETFLEEAFSAKTAAPAHRLHQLAARAVLKALLPEQGTEIRGQMRSYDQLLDTAGYRDRQQDFDALLRILDSEVRLITPTEPDDSTAGATASSTTSRGGFYQLTHDYLVPSLRDWLTRKHKETRRGRAELLLADRAAVWTDRMENRQLPSLWQWIQIKWLTAKSNWTPPQRKMMTKAGRVHAFHSVIATFLLVALVVGVREIYGRIEAKALVEQLTAADIAEVPRIVESLAGYRRWADPLLTQVDGQAKADSKQKLHSALALLKVDEDESKVNYLRDQLLVVTPAQFPFVRDALLPHKASIVEPLWHVALDSKRDEQRRFQAACALATYAPGDERWSGINTFVARHLVTLQTSELVAWREALRRAQSQLVGPLAAIYRNPTQEQRQRSFATETLADYLADQPAALVGLLANVEPFQFPVIFAKLAAQRTQAISLLETELAKRADDKANEDEKERFARRQANSAVALLRLGKLDDVWWLLKHSHDPTVRSYLIHRLGQFGADPMVITNRLEGEPDVTIQRALILSLGEFTKEAWPPGKLESLVANLQEIYDKTSDPGVHAAAEWVLRQRQQDVWLKQLNAQWAQDKDQREKRLQSIGKVLAKGKEKAPPQWYVNGQGQTMVVIPGPMEFLMGSPLTEKDRLGGEGQHRERIERTFAMASKAVTVAEYRRFDPTHALTDDKDPKLGYPVVGTSWYEAAAYCNWLSKEEGIDRNQFCYETTPQGQVTRLRPKYLSLTGYRLPTEAEMEFAIRAGAVTSRYYGEPKELLGNYGWFTDNSEASVWPVGRLKPNDLGLFDMHGNVWCWCQETFHAYPRADRDKVFKDSEFELAIEDKDLRALRGDCYTDHAPGVRSASRWKNKPTDHSNLVGFRPARTISAE